MTIYAITHVRATFARALEVAPDRETAIHATAANLGLPVEAVREAVDREVSHA